MPPVLAKYQFLPTNVLHSRPLHYMTLGGENWYSARIGHMPVLLVLISMCILCFPAHYRPVNMGKQSFIYNAANKWI